jgi:hypothetical protein
VRRRTFFVMPTWERRERLPLPPPPPPPDENMGTGGENSPDGPLCDKCAHGPLEIRDRGWGWGREHQNNVVHSSNTHSPHHHMRAHTATEKIQEHAHPTPTTSNNNNTQTHAHPTPITSNNNGTWKQAHTPNTHHSHV